MKNRIYKVKKLPATNNKGTRIKIIDINNLNNITIPYNYKFKNTLDIALNYIETNLIYLKHNFSFYDKNVLYIVYNTKI